MTVTALILAHYKQRQNNLRRIVDDLVAGTIPPEKIIVFIDNPDIEFEDNRVTIIRSSNSFLPNIRFAIGMVCETDYCFFLDDDLSVREETLENFTTHALKLPDAILGLEGSILGHTDTPYSNDTSIPRGNRQVPVDVVIRTYFAPRKSLLGGLQLRLMYPSLPAKSLDDVFLCMGNKYLNSEMNCVIPVNEQSDLTELPDGGMGQSFNEDHYKNRNIVCKALMDIYE